MPRLRSRNFVVKKDAILQLLDADISDEESLFEVDDEDMTVLEGHRPTEEGKEVEVTIDDAHVMEVDETPAPSEGAIRWSKRCPTVTVPEPTGEFYFVARD